MTTGVFSSLHAATTMLSVDTDTPGMGSVAVADDISRRLLRRGLPEANTNLVSDLVDCAFSLDLQQQLLMPLEPGETEICDATAQHRLPPALVELLYLVFKRASYGSPPSRMWFQHKVGRILSTARSTICFTKDFAEELQVAATTGWKVADNTPLALWQARRRQDPLNWPVNAAYRNLTYPEFNTRRDGFLMMSGAYNKRGARNEMTFWHQRADKDQANNDTTTDSSSSEASNDDNSDDSDDSDHSDNSDNGDNKPPVVIAIKKAPVVIAIKKEPAVIDLTKDSEEDSTGDESSDPVRYIQHKLTCPQWHLL